MNSTRFPLIIASAMFAITVGAVMVIEMRVREAARLLLQTDDTLEAIAEQTGLTNRAYFSRVFKRVTGEARLAFARITEGQSEPEAHPATSRHKTSLIGAQDIGVSRGRRLAPSSLCLEHGEDINTCGLKSENSLRAKLGQPASTWRVSIPTVLCTTRRSTHCARTLCRNSLIKVSVGWCAPERYRSETSRHLG